MLDPARAILGLFAERGWVPFEFQREAWSAYALGRSGLINAPTGVGKTMAAWLGPVGEYVAEERTGARRIEPLRVLWLTPLRALAQDTTRSLLETVESLRLPWTVQARTGDTPQSLRRRQKERLPTGLVTTPESLTLLLSYPDSRERFASLRCIIADEWHELMGSKRGVQAELALARLRRWLPGLRTWGLSATLGNLEQARDVLLGAAPNPARAALIRGEVPRSLDIRTLIPGDIERFPWAGHLGTRSVGAVLEAVRSARTTLLFTNTRAQAEIWFKRLLDHGEDLIGRIAIHHGSLDRGLRARVETMLARGELRCVVCTSSLDLGVDFSPVDQVIQVGSPKGVARLMQRAGRSGHQPGATSRVLGVPTHAFELIEFAAAREAAGAGRIEARPPVERPLDVLVQHLVTIACGEGELGFDADELKAEVRSTHAFRDLTEEDWAWAMAFVSRGGAALGAYPGFSRIVRRDERWVVASERTARAHRMCIGTITGESAIAVKFISGRTLGTIEEGFISRLATGARFVFAGRVLELVRVRGMTAYVRKASARSGIVPRWDGGRFSLSTQMAEAVRARIDGARRGEFDSPEMVAVRPLLELQGRLSRLPGVDEVLIEFIPVDRVTNAFIYFFAGRTAQEGLGSLLAYRLTRRSPATVTAVCNDHGIGLSATGGLDLSEAEWRAAMSEEGLLDDLLACVNSSQMAQRQFRDIARIAGLVNRGPPGRGRPMRHVQASSEMFYGVFEQFDPGNLLVAQAKREVLEAQLEFRRLRDTLRAAGGQRLTIVRPGSLTPMAFPIWAETLRADTLSTEKWSDMVAKMVVGLEGGAGGRESAAVHGAGRVKGRRSRGRTFVGR